MEVAKESCRICKRQADCYHFGVLSCRPCASFFRRAVISKRTYKCLENESCQINEAKCKACRFALCQKFGMKTSYLQSNRDPLGPKRLQQKEINKDPDLDRKSLPQTDYSFLNDLLVHFYDFEHSEKALYALLFPEYANRPIEYRPTIHTDFIKMERGTMTLSMTLAEQWLPIICEQSYDLKRTLLRAFFPTFSGMLKCYRTSKIYPNEDDSRIVLSYGQYENIMNSAFHFQHNKNPKEAERHCRGFHFKSRTLANKLKELEVNELEIVAMGALLLCNELEILIGNHQKIDEFRLKIYKDLYKLASKNQTNDNGKRVGLLICFLSELYALAREVIEVVTLLKVFSPHRIELFDD